MILLAILLTLLDNGSAVTLSRKFLSDNLSPEERNTCHTLRADLALFAWGAVCCLAIFVEGANALPSSAAIATLSMWRSEHLSRREDPVGMSAIPLRTWDTVDPTGKLPAWE